MTTEPDYHGPADSVIRRATLADVVLLAPIEEAGDAQFVAAGHAEFANAATISDDAAVRAIIAGWLLVATSKGRLVGWVQLEREGVELVIRQICVHPSMQRCGLGSALVEAAATSAGKAAEPSLVLDTQDDISWNRPWYERRGFVVVPEAEWTPSMRAITAEQTAAGFDWGTRVHMRRVL